LWEKISLTISISLALWELLYFTMRYSHVKCDVSRRDIILSQKKQSLITTIMEVFNNIHKEPKKGRARLTSNSLIK
jgi:hypothetical protein